MRSNSGIFLWLLSLYFTHHCVSMEFDRKYFGVTFSPYVKYKEPNTDISYKAYTKENIETMLTVLSSKFSKVFVTDDYFFEEKYTPNVSYNNGSYASLYTGEMAAKLNKNNGKKVLSLWYEISMSETDLEAEVQLVFEAAEKSNHIFPGTVDGIIFGNTDSLENVETILQYYQTYKDKSIELGVKLGAELISCYHFLNENNETLISAQKKVIEKSEIVTCGEIKSGNPVIGPEDSFLSIGRDLLTFKTVFETINPNAQLVGNVQWSSLGKESWETAENLKVYWESANKFAMAEKFPVFLKEAFDNPVRVPPYLGHLGWWKLDNNSNINSIRGYIEKTTEKSMGNFAERSPISPASLTWTVTAIMYIRVTFLLSSHV